MSDLRDKFTVTRKAELYSDFLTDLDRNPITGFLAKATNENAVKQSVRNLILTTRTERFYRSDIGSKTKSLLFEPMDESTTELLRTTIGETITNCEPRVHLINVYVEADENFNAYFVNIVFEIVNIPNETFDLSLVLKRVR